jgi:hypothetical protein
MFVAFLFLELCDTIIIKDVTPASIRLRLFPFSLAGKAKQWFYKKEEVVDMWDKCSVAFLVKFFPMGKTNALREKISNFQQTSMESIPETWERLQDYIQRYPNHRMENWLMLQGYAYVEEARRCRCWRRVSFPHHQFSHESH